MVKEYIGGYDDWLRQRLVEAKLIKVSKDTPPTRAIRPKAKFGFRQQKELDSLPLTIQELETEQEDLYRAMGNPDHYKNDKSEIVEKKKRLEVVKKLLDTSYTRWEELEQLKNESST
jgi:ATP-binding cassette subfamily F protein uup